MDILKLHEVIGQQYNPRKAIDLFERLADGDDGLLQDDALITTIRRALVRNYPLEPKFDKGKNGKKYDRYSCGNCGYGVSEAGYKYCPSCGQKITDAYLGRRKTQAEQEERSSDGSYIFRPKKTPLV